MGEIPCVAIVLRHDSVLSRHPNALYDLEHGGPAYHKYEESQQPGTNLHDTDVVSSKLV